MEKRFISEIVVGSWVWAWWFGSECGWELGGQRPQKLFWENKALLPFYVELTRDLPKTTSYKTWHTLTPSSFYLEQSRRNVSHIQMAGATLSNKWLHL